MSFQEGKTLAVPHAPINIWAHRVQWIKYLCMCNGSMKWVKNSNYAHTLCSPYEVWWFSWEQQWAVQCCSGTELTCRWEQGMDDGHTRLVWVQSALWRTVMRRVSSQQSSGSSVVQRLRVRASDYIRRVQKVFIQLYSVRTCIWYCAPIKLNLSVCLVPDFENQEWWVWQCKYVVRTCPSSNIWHPQLCLRNCLREFIVY